MREIEIKTTGNTETTEASDGRLSVRIPIQVKRRNGRKLIKTPSGQLIGKPWDIEPTVLQLALARGHRWRRMFESDEADSIKEIAKREGIDNSYVSRMINLTTLAPEIVEAILDDNLPDDITLFELAVDPSMLWVDQLKIGCKKLS